MNGVPLQQPCRRSPRLLPSAATSRWRPCRRRTWQKSSSRRKQDPGLTLRRFETRDYLLCNHFPNKVDQGCGAETASEGLVSLNANSNLILLFSAIRSAVLRVISQSGQAM